MNRQSEKESFAFYESYPGHVMIFRWIVLAVIFGLGVYVLSDIKEILGVAYVIYSVVALTFILPLSRCVSCYYYGKACNTGWGRLAAYLFPKGDESQYVKHYSYAILLHLLWVIPFFASFFQLLRRKEIVTLIVFLSYLLLLLVERVTLRKVACTRCHQKYFCPAVPFRKIGVDKSN